MLGRGLTPILRYWQWVLCNLNNGKEKLKEGQWNVV